MRVLLVNKFLERRGGVETYVLELGRMLTEAGNEVQYFGMDCPEREVGNDWGIYAPNVELGKRARKKRPSDVFSVISSSDNARRFKGLLDRFSPDIIHFNNIHYHLTPSVILAASAYRSETAKPVGLVMTMHDYHTVVPCDGCFNNTTFELCEKCLDGHYFRCLMNRCVRGGRARALIATLETSYWHVRGVYNLLDLVVCPSAFLQRRVEAANGLSVRTAHLRNFSYGERRQYQKSRYVLYFGGYYRNKGIGTLLDVAERHPEISFVFAGGGDAEYERRMAVLPNTSNVGFMQGRELREVIGGALLSVLPSEWYENSPFSVIESQMFGTPVLGADIGGIGELMVPGVTGELFEFRNPSSLEEHLVALWNDPDKLRKYSSNCVYYDPMGGPRYVQRILSMYREVLDK